MLKPDVEDVGRLLLLCWLIACAEEQLILLSSAFIWFSEIETICIYRCTKKRGNVLQRGHGVAYYKGPTERSREKYSNICGT